MNLLPVDEALSRVLASIDGPVSAETVPLELCNGRTLADDVVAKLTQPPFDASAMDGYALRVEDAASVPVTLKVIGQSAAGRPYEGATGPGEAVRIFTGAPLPQGADTIVIQEDTQGSDGHVTILDAPRGSKHIRKAGLDFKTGQVLIKSGQRLDARHIALAAAMGHGALSVRRKPKVAILATGDELVQPGEAAKSGQIMSSNPYAVAAYVDSAGGEPLLLGIAADTMASLEEAIVRAKESEADVLVTLGGASVGDHDLVQPALKRHGLELGFWKVAMRPGKPLIHGRLGSMLLLGLPGNPVAVAVCSMVFLIPAIQALLGDPLAGADHHDRAILGADLPKNGPRRDYMRAAISRNDEGRWVATGVEIQDSSMLSALAQADGLIVREPNEPAAKAGENCNIIRFDAMIR